MQDLTTVERCKEWIGGIPNGEVKSVAVSSGGTGYHAETTTLDLTGVTGQGTDFDAVPVIVAGVIVAVSILNPGRLYLKGSPPTLVATDTDIVPGSGAAFTLEIAEIDSSADALLARLVSAASAFFLQLCSRNIIIGPVSIFETRNGHVGQRVIPTLENPISAVASLSVNGTPVTASTGPLSSGYGFDADTVFLRGMTLSEGFGNVQLSYTAGFDPAGPEAAMIEQAVTELVAQKYERRKHIDLVSRGTSIAGGSQTTTFSQKDVPAEVQTVIDRFTRPMIAGLG